MTHTDIKLLALAVIWGSSLFAFAIAEEGGKDLLMLLAVVVIGIWFLLYWFLWPTPPVIAVIREGRRNREDLPLTEFLPSVGERLKVIRKE